MRHLLWAALLLGACARPLSPRDDDLRPDAHHDLGRPDGRGDAPARDRASLDLSPPAKLSCSAPSLAGDGYEPNAGGLAEIALDPDGLRLYSWCAVGRCRASRAAVGEPLGEWTAAPELPFGNDPAFFVYLGEPRLIIARSGNNSERRLELCSWPALGCKPLPILDAVGQVSYDMDGPSVAVVGSRVLLAHNIGVGGSATADLFLAEPIDASDLGLGFRTTALAAINQPSRKEDDPALSPDGLVLIFGAPNGTAGEDLWVSQRSSLGDPFPAAELLPGLGSGADDKGAYFGPLPPLAGKTRYELFFESARSGKTKVYRSVCQR
jgi:hypothetical protein